jgi:hypothetical protein
VPITPPLLFCGALLGQELGAHNRDGDAPRTLGGWAGRLKEVIPVADLVTDRSAPEGAADMARAVVLSEWVFAAAAVLKLGPEWRTEGRADQRRIRKPSAISLRGRGSPLDSVPRS